MQEYEKRERERERLVWVEEGGCRENHRWSLCCILIDQGKEDHYTNDDNDWSVP